MIKLLLDTNVILDIALKRLPFFNDAVAIFSKIDEQLIKDKQNSKGQVL